MIPTLPRAPRTPDRSAFTTREWQTVQAHRTPLSVQRWLRTVPYNREPNGATLRTFRGALRVGRAHCLEAVLVAATILEQHRLPPMVLDLESQDGLDHVLFLYQRGGRWGTVARSRDEGLHGRRPVFPTIEALVDSYMDPYVDGAGRVVGWGTAHLDALVRTDWRFSLRNVKSVERELIVMKHRRIRMAESRYRAALARFNDWKAAGRTITPRSMHTLYGPQTRSWL